MLFGWHCSSNSHMPSIFIPFLNWLFLQGTLDWTAAGIEQPMEERIQEPGPSTQVCG